MSQQTGEDEHSLRKIIDFLRMGSICLLLLHCWFDACPPCVYWQTSTPMAGTLLSAILSTGLFDPAIKLKLIVLLLLAASLLGARGKKMPELKPAKALAPLAAGLFLYFTSGFLLENLLLYAVLCFTGYLLILRSAILLTRIVWQRPEPDLFNRLHESFPQEQSLLQNPNSINLPARYLFNDTLRDSWINLIDPFRGTLILGSPGSGKTWYIIEPMIKQYIAKGFALLVYDFKYDDLSRIVYNHFERFKDRYPGTSAHYNLHLGDLNRSHRANPLHPSTLFDLQDAGEAARAVLLGMQSEGGGHHHDFFLDSAINFVQALVWFLRLYKNGRYCSWPHVIELAQTSYKDLFAILAAEPQLVALVTPFSDAFKNAPEQLSGQIASATIGLAKLSSPNTYYIMTGNDFDLDLNDPAAPKLLTIGSNPQKTDTYGPMIAAYINTINRLANRKHRHPLAEIFDEFSTVKIHTIIRSLATGRSNKMAITLCAQDASQLRLAYGKDFTDVILNTCGNIFSGATGGDTAKSLVERFGKTMQERESHTTTGSDLHVTQSRQLEYVIPLSRIASLSSGEFVGMVVDTPEQPIAVKTFCCRLVNDPAALTQESAEYKELPTVRDVSEKDLLTHFQQIRKEIAQLVRDELVRINNLL
jgi:YWFCY protein/Type IV secretory system Conjugative DNA transfer